jgi:hypothetical protein
MPDFLLFSMRRQKYAPLTGRIATLLITAERRSVYDTLLQSMHRSICRVVCPCKVVYQPAKVHNPYLRRVRGQRRAAPGNCSLCLRLGDKRRKARA